MDSNNGLDRPERYMGWDGSTVVASKTRAPLALSALHAMMTPETSWDGSHRVGRVDSALRGEFAGGDEETQDVLCKSQSVD